MTERNIGLISIPHCKACSNVLSVYESPDVLDMQCFFIYILYKYYKLEILSLNCNKLKLNSKKGIMKSPV